MGEYLVKIYRDEQTNRAAATERVEQFLSNENLTIAEAEEVDLIVLRRTDIGYLMIINNIHTGVLHFNEVYRTIGVGDKFKGYVKKISADKPSNSANIGTHSVTNHKFDIHKSLFDYFGFRNRMVLFLN